MERRRFFVQRIHEQQAHAEQTGSSHCLYEPAPARRAGLWRPPMLRALRRTSGRRLEPLRVNAPGMWPSHLQVRKFEISLPERTANALAQVSDPCHYVHYDRTLRPFVEAVHAEAVRTAAESLVPRTQAEIDARNAKPGDDF